MSFCARKCNWNEILKRAWMDNERRANCTSFPWLGISIKCVCNNMHRHPPQKKNTDKRFELIHHGPFPWVPLLSVSDDGWDGSLMQDNYGLRFSLKWEELHFKRWNTWLGYCLDGKIPCSLSIAVRRVRKLDINPCLMRFQVSNPFYFHDEKAKCFSCPTHWAEKCLCLIIISHPDTGALIQRRGGKGKVLSFQLKKKVISLSYMLAKAPRTMLLSCKAFQSQCNWDNCIL